MSDPNIRPSEEKQQGGNEAPPTEGKSFFSGLGRDMARNSVIGLCFASYFPGKLLSCTVAESAFVRANEPYGLVGGAPYRWVASCHDWVSWPLGLSVVAIWFIARRLVGPTIGSKLVALVWALEAIASAVIGYWFYSQHSLF